MDDEQDDDREREERAAAETSAESEDRRETEDREAPDTPAPEEPAAYTPEEYELAAKLKARRLYKEEEGRIPYSDAELFHFLLKAKIESPVTPDDEDLEAARRKLAGS